MPDDLPIGIFDSGVGGLTVVKEIMHQLPEEKIIYFGDTARVPYGNKSKDTVITYSRQITHFLESKQVKAIVIACNTASALALDVLSRETKTPILGVTKPGAYAAGNATKNGHIGVIATEGTVQSQIYPQLLLKQNKNYMVYQKACPLFVPLVEEGWLYDSVTREVCNRYLSDLLTKEIDTLVLGCTHYPLLYDIINETVGDKITLINPAFETARALKCRLEEMDMLRKSKQTEHKFYVSDGTEKFRQFANTILPCNMIETKDVHVETF